MGLKLCNGTSVAPLFRRWLDSMKDWHKDEGGSLMIETALGLSIMFTMVLGAMEFCMMGYTYSVYADAARAGVRYAMTHGIDSTNCSGPSTVCTDSTGANVASTVTSHVTGLTTLATGVNVNVNYPDNSSAPLSRVTVTVTYTYTPMFGAIRKGPSFSTTSAGRIVY